MDLNAETTLVITPAKPSPSSSSSTTVVTVAQDEHGLSILRLVLISILHCATRYRYIRLCDYPSGVSAFNNAKRN